MSDPLWNLGAPYKSEFYDYPTDDEKLAFYRKRWPHHSRQFIVDIIRRTNARRIAEWEFWNAPKVASS